MVGLVKISAPVLPVAPLGMPVRIGLGMSPSAMRITRLSVGRADVGVHQPVLRVGRRQHDVHQPAVAAAVDRDDGLDLGFGPDGDLFDRAGRPLGDQCRLAVGQHDQAAGALQAALHDPGRRALLGERLRRQRRRRAAASSRPRLQLGFGGERLRLGVVESGAAATPRATPRTTGRRRPHRPAQSHARQVTDCSAVRATPVLSARLTAREYAAQKRRANPRFTGD